MVETFLNVGMYSRIIAYRDKCYMNKQVLRILEIYKHTHTHTHTHVYNLGYNDLNPQNYAFLTKIIKLVQKKEPNYLPSLTPKLWISDRNHHQIRSKHRKICQKNHSVTHWEMLAYREKKKKHRLARLAYNRQKNKPVGLGLASWQSFNHFS